MNRNRKPFYSIFVRLWFAAKMAMHGILANPLRSALTVLGVAIGVASVVSLMGIGEGARQAVVEQFKSLGSNVIAVKSQHASAEFSPDYADELVERVDGLKTATPVVHTKAMMKWRRKRGSVEITGVNSKFPEIRDHELADGHFFSALHVKQRSPVAVLGYNLGVNLWNGRSVVGSTLTLNGHTYKIIGILTPKGEGNAEGIDNKILSPYTTALKIAEKKTVEEIWGKAGSMANVDLAVVQMSRIIKTKLGLNQKAPNFRNIMQGGEQQAPLPEGENGVAVKMAEPVPEPEPEPKPALPDLGEDLVTITNLNNLVNEADSANRVMTLLLGGIAAVSLLVGGLGIMNIMMVSVNERTEEIGVRRALGAKQGDLLLQFILEALYVSAIGSLAGIVAGIWGLNLFDGIGFETAVSFQAVKIATVVALASGLLFGVYPAVSASSVPPVEALRSQ